MKYLFVGDTHGHKDLDKVKAGLAVLSLTPQDALIHCGDFGAPWIEDSDDTLRWWQQLPMKKIICLGNHENYGYILSLPVVRRWGALGYDLGGGLFAPLPGEILILGGRTFWFYPGGLSIDFFLRTPGRSVFPEELTDSAAAERALSKLRRRGPVDYIISHDGPRSHVQERFGFPIKEPPDFYFKHLGQAAGSRAHPGFVLDRVPQGHYGRWYFGHHHRDDRHGRLRCLWQQMVLEDSKTGILQEV